MVKCNEFSEIDDDDGGVKDHEYSKEQNEYTEVLRPYVSKYGLCI